MDIRSFPDSVASLLLGAAHELDETAVDHDLVNGSTFTGKAIRFVATGLVLGAIPWVALDVITGGLARRTKNSADEAATGPSEPVWWGFLQK